MGQQPTKAADNVYCKYRKKAAAYNDRLNSREDAAVLLNISSASLADYELGIRRVPVDIVIKMADLYNAPELRNEHCRCECPLGFATPEINVDNLDRISIQALASFSKINCMKEDLLTIVEDGIISEDEVPKLNRIVSTLEELEAISKSLKGYIEKHLERRKSNVGNDN